MAEVDTQLQCVDGKVMKIIYDIYENAKSCVKCDNGLSDCFVASCGVRQGKNLSPILFGLPFTASQYCFGKVLPV